MRRHLIGILALLLLLGAGIFSIWPPQGTFAQAVEAACWRTGALAGVLWLAYADLRRMPLWLLGTFLAGAVVVALRPKAALLILPVIIALAILRPRFGKRR